MLSVKGISKTKAQYNQL